LGLHVMMICQDPELVTDLATALDELDRLTVVESPAAVGHAGREVDAVVVDLPPEARRAVCEEVRERYPGQLVVSVDDGDEVAGWPPDPARRVLVRPFEAAELVAGLEPETLSPERAAEARRQVRLRPLGLIRPDTAEPLDPPPSPDAAGSTDEDGTPAGTGAPGAQAAPGAEAPPGAPGTEAPPGAPGAEAPPGAPGAEAPPGAPGTEAPPGAPGAEAPPRTDDGSGAPGAEAPERLSPDEPLWDPPAGPALPGSGGLAKVGATGTRVDRAPGTRDRRPVILDRTLGDPEPQEAPSGRRTWRVVLGAAAATALFLAGALVGTILASDRPNLLAAPAATAAPAAPASTVAPRPAPAPKACADAIDDADAAISYLVAKIRDERLSESLKRYGEHARACRIATR